MTPFEFVFALISIISSLALTHIIAGVIAIVRHQDRGGFSLTHALWVWVAFAVVIGNWGALWGARLNPDWPAFRVLAWLVSMSSLYAFCALVIPEVERGKSLDLARFHEQEGRRYIIAHNVFAVVAILLVVTLSGVTDDSMRNLVPPAVALALGSAALFTRGRAQLAVSVLLALLALAFMLSNLALLSSGAPQ